MVCFHCGVYGHHRENYHALQDEMEMADKKKGGASSEAARAEGQVNDRREVFEVNPKLMDLGETFVN